MSGTGNLNSLITYQSGVLGGSGAATTAWNYDPNTDQLQYVQYADLTTKKTGQTKKTRHSYWMYLIESYYPVRCDWRMRYAGRRKREGHGVAII